MKYRYVTYEVDPSPTLPSGLLHRPEVTIVVVGPRGAEAIQSLVDTGSDETVFPISLAATLGVELDYDAVEKASAVGGHVVRLVPGSVELELAQGDDSYRWRATVGFLDVSRPEDEVALLGYAGFLEFFSANFDSLNQALELTPHGIAGVQ